MVKRASDRSVSVSGCGHDSAGELISRRAPVFASCASACSMRKAPNRALVLCSVVSSSFVVGARSEGGLGAHWRDKLSTMPLSHARIRKEGSVGRRGRSKAWVSDGRTVPSIIDSARRPVGERSGRCHQREYAIEENVPSRRDAPKPAAERQLETPALEAA